MSWIWGLTFIWEKEGKRSEAGNGCTGDSYKRGVWQEKEMQSRKIAFLLICHLHPSLLSWGLLWVMETPWDTFTGILLYPSTKHLIDNEGLLYFLRVQGMEPSALCMLGKCSGSKLHSQCLGRVSSVLSCWTLMISRDGKLLSSLEGGLTLSTHWGGFLQEALHKLYWVQLCLQDGT